MLGKLSSMRSFAFALLLLPGSAGAGDMAEFRIHGFSEDGRTFAFEEFGVQDGSGFPYATIFLIDLDRDAWVPGTPVKRLIEDESASDDRARAEALAQAQPILNDQGISGARWSYLALQPIGSVGVDDKRLVFGFPNPAMPTSSPVETYRLELATFPSQSTGSFDCETMLDRPVAGFELTAVNTGTGAERLIHRDQSVPKSRSCPFDYRLMAVVAPRTDYGVEPVGRVVAIIAVVAAGFEGPDVRYLALPVVLPRPA